MFELYKPNQKNTGAGCFFRFDFPDFGLGFIKQFSWDANTRSGTFKGNKKNPEKEVFVQINITEAAAIVDCIENNREFNTYHKSANQKTSIKFSPYIYENENKVEVQKGFSFSVNKIKPIKLNNIIGVTFAEAILLREFLLVGINCVHAAKNEDDMRRQTEFQNNKNTQPRQEKQEPAPTQEETPEPPAENNQDLW